MARLGHGRVAGQAQSSAKDEEHEDLGIILGATLTLLEVTIGYSIAMAGTRYDQRKKSRKPRPTRSVPKCYVLIFCHRRMLRMSVAFLAPISTSASCSTSTGMTPANADRSVDQPIAG